MTTDDQIAHNYHLATAYYAVEIAIASGTGGPSGVLRVLGNFEVAFRDDQEPNILFEALVGAMAMAAVRAPLGQWTFELLNEVIEDGFAHYHPRVVADNLARLEGRDRDHAGALMVNLGERVGRVMSECIDIPY